MVKKEIFGTDGIRAKANVYPLSPESAVVVGRAITRWFYKENSTKQITAAIGMDTRISSRMLNSAVAAGIMSAGGDVVDLGVVPTPFVSHFVRSRGYDFGIVISASHNPFYDNGIKIFNAQGAKLNDAAELEIEKLFFDDSNFEPLTGEKIGKTVAESNFTRDYIEKLVSLNSSFKNSKFKICLDCACGAAAEIAQKVFAQFPKFSLNFFSLKADGININDNCGALYPENLSPEIIKNRCDAGFAFDGDGDRVIALDELGRVVDGDKLIGIFAEFLNKNNMLNKNTIAVTIMSNAGLVKYLNKIGVDVVRTNVGDRYLFEKIKEMNLSLAGENSGHLILTDINPTGDGMAAALTLLKIMAETGKKLSELADKIELFPQITTKIKIRGKKTPIEQIPGFLELIKSNEEKLEGGRMVVRYSGTEPVLRVMAEGENLDAVRGAVAEVADFIDNFQK